MPSPELIIFDCDGVLVDSEIIAARIDAELITAAGFPIDAGELAERYAGLTFRDILLEIEKEADIPFQASLIDEEQRQLSKRLAREARAIDGAFESVASVACKRCVCSNSPADRLKTMLEKVGIAPLFSGNLFSAVSTPGVEPKPSPDIFRYAAKAMSADPANTFVIEDSVHGIQGAKAAGMRVIGFVGGSHSWLGHADKLTEAGAETVIRRHADLNGVIAALSEWADV
ncbi:MAG: HAD family phosphatase [Mesorhizobium sp.]